jgi:hypothetical protein
MTTMTLSAPTVKPSIATTLTIKGLAYRVAEIDPGEEGTAAFRLEKVRGEGLYDVVRTHQGLVVCDCPDFVCRHEGKGTVCKHGAAMVARGFLPVASVIASKPTVAPITRKDKVRSSYFGIKLPAAPLAVEAPVVVPVVEVQPPVVVEVESARSDINLSNFASRTLTIEPVAFLHPENFADAPAGQEWVAITPTAGVLRDVEPTGPRPTRLARFTPTPEMEMEHLGYTLGREGEDAMAPEGRTFIELVAFYGGWLQGKADQETEFNAWLASVEADRERMDDAFGSPEDTWPEAELLIARQSSGHLAFEA